MVQQEHLHASNLDSAADKGEVEPKKLEGKKDNSKEYKNEEIDIEEEKPKKIEEEGEGKKKQRKKYKEKLAKKKKKWQEREKNLKNFGEKEDEESTEGEGSEDSFAYNFIYCEDEYEDESEDSSEEKYKKDDEEQEYDNEEEEEEENIEVRKRKRCQRKKEMKKFSELERSKILAKTKKEFWGEDFDSEEEYIDEEVGEDEDFVYYSVSHSSAISILSAISFEFEEKMYEFEELCDPGNINNIYRKYSILPGITDGTGRQRYLAICKNLSVAPITRFIVALENSEIDLSFQAFDYNSIRAICAALEGNTFVKKLILRCNILTPDDCRFLGLMLKYNDTLKELNLSECRIGPEGVKKLVEFLPQNVILEVLNLSKCNIQNEGLMTLSQALNGNNSVRVLDLSYNKLGEESVEALSVLLQFNNTITDLNLRYNYFFTPSALKELFFALTANNHIKNLNLSWNGMSGKEVGTYIGNYLRKNHTLREFDLSSNRFQGPAINEIKKGLNKSTDLEILKFGKNPANAEDLEILLAGAKGSHALTLLDLEELWVEKSFMKSLEKIRATRDLKVILGGVFGSRKIKGPDYPAIILKRAQYEASKPKKKKLKKDFGHFIWTLGDEPLTINEFMEKVKKFKAKINKELFPELIEQFLIQSKNLIDVGAMKEKYLSIFPYSTPPPPKKTTAKGKKGKKAKEQKESVKQYGPRVTFADIEKDQLISFSKFEAEEDASEEEMEGEGGVTYNNLVFESWISSDEGEFFDYYGEDDSENEEKERKKSMEKLMEKENDKEVSDNQLLMTQAASTLLIVKESLLKYGDTFDKSRNDLKTEGA